MWPPLHHSLKQNIIFSCALAKGLTRRVAVCLDCQLHRLHAMADASVSGSGAVALRIGQDAFGGRDVVALASIVVNVFVDTAVAGDP